jgi:hypothetical protein
MTMEILIIIALSITLGSLYSLLDARFEWMRINKKLYAEHRNLNLLVNIALAAAGIILGFYVFA